MEILKHQKDMIKLIDKKLDLDVWQKVNHSKVIHNNMPECCKM